MTISSRQKAIIVGSVLGGTEIIHYYNGNEAGQNSYSLKINPIIGDSHFNLWIANELIDIDWTSLDAQSFLSKAYHVFYGQENIEDTIAWLNKTSPLALTVFHRCISVEFGIFPTYDLDNEALTKPLQESFQKRWGINLNYDAEKQILCPNTEEDAISLWCLLDKYIIECCPQLIPNLEAKYKRNHKQIYLSGAQEKSLDKGIGIRSKIIPQLFKLGYTVFSPPFEEGLASDHFGVNWKQLKEENFSRYMQLGSSFIDKDLSAILASDFILVYFDSAAHQGAGTVSEMTLCYAFNKPMLVVLGPDYKKEDLPIWLLGSIKHENNIFQSFDEAINEIQKEVA